MRWFNEFPKKTNTMSPCKLIPKSTQRYLNLRQTTWDYNSAWGCWNKEHNCTQWISTSGCYCGVSKEGIERIVRLGGFQGFNHFIGTHTNGLGEHISKADGFVRFSCIVAVHRLVNILLKVHYNSQFPLTTDSEALDALLQQRRVNSRLFLFMPWEGLKIAKKKNFPEIFWI